MQTRVYPGLIVVLTLLLTGGGFVGRAHALGTAFTYQGQLRQAGTPTTGMCDFQFHLFDAASEGAEIGTMQTPSNVSVTGGLFTVQLDFGTAAFTGADRWLEIAVRCPAGAGTFATLSPRQPLTPAPYALFSPVVVRDANGNARASMEVLQSGEGFIATRGANGNVNVLLSSLVNQPNNGSVGVYDSDGNERANMAVLESGAGFVQTRGPNGKLNVLISFLQDHPNNGFIGVYDPDGNVQAGIYADTDGKGTVFGDTKNFAVDHPNQPGSKIIYTSLEGPEVAIYHRGVVKLTAGRATIELPEHFTALAKPDSITVQLTPGSLDSQGLAIGAIHDGRIEVGELHNGRGSYEVHFIVHALRQGYENRQPVVSAKDFRARFNRVSTDEEVRGSITAVSANAFPAPAVSVQRTEK